MPMMDAPPTTAAGQNQGCFIRSDGDSADADAAPRFFFLVVVASAVYAGGGAVYAGGVVLRFVVVGAGAGAGAGISFCSAFAA